MLYKVPRELVLLWSLKQILALFYFTTRSQGHLAKWADRNQYPAVLVTVNSYKQSQTPGFVNSFGISTRFEVSSFISFKDGKF